MSRKTKSLFRRLGRKSGGSLVEYALILALIAMLTAVVLRGIGQNTNSKLAGVLPGFSD